MPAPAPSKLKLNKSRVLNKAATIMRSNGPKGLTIRRLATELNVSPMAIYRHFESKDAILSALFNEFIAEASVLPDVELAWDQWLIHMGRRMYQAQVATPMWIGLLGSLQVPHQGLVVINRCTEVLVAAGFSNTQALQAFFSVVHVSMGAALLSSGLEKLEPTSAFHPESQAEAQMLLSRFSSIDAITQTLAIDVGLNTVVAGLRQQCYSQPASS